MRVRLRFTKTGKVRFTSHRDVARMWERAFRRADLPVALSEGFTPRPRVHFGLALSTGHESLGEYLDVDLVPGAEVDLATLPARCTGVLPDGIECVAARVVETGEPSLQEAVTVCTWQIDAVGLDGPGMAAAVARALAADAIELERERKGKRVVDDVRPTIVDLVVVGEVDGQCGERGEPVVRLVAELATRPRGLRPAELLAAVDPALVEWRVVRLHQWIERTDGPEGARREEPLPSSATEALRAEVRAS